MTETSKPEPYRAALYARKLFFELSLPGTTDLRASDKIQEMKRFLTDYPDIQITGVYMDTYRSNADHPLPNFHQMIQDIMDGKYSCVVMYSLHTFGRSAEENRSYAQQLFAPMGLRILSVSDHYDSTASEPEPGKLKYFEELIEQSREAAIALRNATREEKNKAIRPRSSTNIPYGYRFDPKAEEQFVVDPESAKYVHYIFDLFVGGTNIADITESLNTMGVPNPLQRKKQMGFQFKRSAICTFWKNETVRTILANTSYIGDYKFGRRWATPSQSTDVIDGISGVLHNHHEPIISIEQFKQAQALLEENVRNHHERQKNGLPKVRAPHIRLPVICGECGRVMVRKTKNIQGETCSFFLCSSAKYQMENPCPPRVFSVTDTTASLQEALEQERCLAFEIRERLDELATHDEVALLEDHYKIMISELMERERQNSTTIYRLQNTEPEQRRELEASSDVLRKQLVALINERQRIRQLLNTKNQWLNLFTGLEENFVLSTSIVTKYVQAIYLYRDTPMVIEFKQAEEKEKILSSLSLLKEAQDRLQEQS